MDATLVAGLAVAAGTWAALFALDREGFWARVAPAGAVVGAYGAVAERHRLGGLLDPTVGDVAVGIASAAVLWAVFAAVRNALPRLAPALAAQVDALYELRARARADALPAVLVVVAVGEELFWRGFVQHRAGFAVALAGYVVVLVWERKLALLAAAAAAGAWWGALAAWTGTLVAPIVSHVLWDLAVMVYLPLPRPRARR